MENIIKLENLTKKYKNFSLNKINLNIDKGDIMGFIGPNGSGKSTTIKLIMNLIKKDSGDITIFGKDNIKDELYIKDKIGFVYDNCLYNEQLNLDTTKKIISRFYSEWDDNVYYKYLDLFGLNSKSKVKELSKGMKMKYSLAIALSHNAKFYIMDEPTSGLDPFIREEILDILYEEARKNEKTIFLSSHIISDLEKICNKVSCIYKGNMIFSENKNELLNRYKIIKGNSDKLELLDKSKFIGLKQFDSEFEAMIEKNHENLFLNNDLFIKNPNIEEITIFLTRGK